MLSLLAHAAVPLTLGLGLGTRAVSPRLLAAGVAASMAPDLDAIGLHLGVACSETAGHRGLTHSLAVLLALLAAACRGAREARRRTN